MEICRFFQQEIFRFHRTSIDFRCKKIDYNRQYFGLTADLENNLISAMSSCNNSKGPLMLFRIEQYVTFSLFSKKSIKRQFSIIFIVCI